MVDDDLPGTILLLHGCTLRKPERNCHGAIEKIIANLQAKPEQSSPPKLTNIQKIRMIEETIEREIRPALQRDGGDVELIDVVENRVLVAKRGACSFCKASEQTLKNFVEVKLRELVSPDLTVEEVSQ